MECPKCKNKTKVIDKRNKVNFTIRRRRECLSCGNRFTTKEITERNYLVLMEASMEPDIFYSTIEQAVDNYKSQTGG